MYRNNNNDNNNNKKKKKKKKNYNNNDFFSYIFTPERILELYNMNKYCLLNIILLSFVPLIDYVKKVGNTLYVKR